MRFMGKDDVGSVPFKPEGGLGKAYQLFGEELGEG